MCTAGRVIKTISTYAVVCVTSVDDELFALLQRNYTQVAVYSINDYRLLRRIRWPGLEPFLGINVMTSCVRHKCLYASDYDNRCIHRYDLSSSTVSKWSVPGKPCCLSVTPGSCNLLVGFWGYYVWKHREPSKLVELRADSGQVVREIRLQSDIELLHHAVQLTTGQYVVCHSLLNPRHRVCMVDDKGRVTRSYGGQGGSGVGQLAVTRHLAVDEDSQYIFVADCLNHRVVLLCPKLELVGEFRNGVSDPWRLYFHQTTQRLFVGQQVGGVDVIQL